MVNYALIFNGELEPTTINTVRYTCAKAAHGGQSRASALPVPSPKSP